MSTQPYSGEALQKGIENALKREMETTYTKLKEELMEKLDKEKDTIISGIALNLMKEVRFEYVGDLLRIEIKTDKI